MGTIWLRLCLRTVSAIATTGNTKPLKSDLRADTTCLAGGTLKRFEYDCSVNVQGYDPVLGIKEYRTIHGALAYIHPFTGMKYHLSFPSDEIGRE